MATHAWTVAPGYWELETGIEWDHDPDDTHSFSTPTLLKIGLGRRMQLGIQETLNQTSEERLGPGDLGLLLKYRLADHVPGLGAFAILPQLKLPTAKSTHGTTTTDLSVLLISSHQLGPVSLDLNLGYTRRSGDGSHAPRDATLWTVSAGFPVGGSLGMAAEVFGYPGTSGPAGASAMVGLLAGPTFTVSPAWVIDLGGIVALAGPQPDAVYAGLVYNLGRLW